MKTLENHLILFDAACPMCNFYTKAFVKTGMLDKAGRAAYQDFSAETCPLLDRQRAVNEIALINRSTGEVSYGIHSLFKVFAAAMPFFKPLFMFSPFVWLMSKVYAFISYNRRVIIPAAIHTDSTELQPTFRLDYRLIFLLFTWFVTAYILSAYTGLMGSLLPDGHGYREYFVCGGQIVFQGLIISLVNKDKKWEYLGNMMAISFAGALLLLPALLMAKLLVVAPIFYAGYFMAVAGLMFLEHIRRSQLLHIGWTLTISWALYRVAVLFIIIESVI